MIKIIEYLKLMYFCLILTRLAFKKGRNMHNYQTKWSHLAFLNTNGNPEPWNAFDNDFPLRRQTGKERPLRLSN
jgi:hypothetical protein